MAASFETKWAMTRLVKEISPRPLRFIRDLGGRLLDEANLIPPQPTPVAIATKFETKLAITWLV